MTDAPKQPTASERAERTRLMEIDGKKARDEYASAASRADDNIVRLRALRLERERQEEEAKAAAAPPPKAPRSRKPRSP